MRLDILLGSRTQPRLSGARTRLRSQRPQRDDVSNRKAVFSQNQISGRGVALLLFAGRIRNQRIVLPANLGILVAGTALFRLSVWLGCRMAEKPECVSLGTATRDGHVPA